MSLSIIEMKAAVKLLSEFWARRVSEGLGNAIRPSFSVRGNVLTLIDGGPTLFNERELHYRRIAQFRYNASNRFWSLYHVNRHGKWHQYECSPTKNLEELMNHVDEDPMGVFWLASISTE